MIKLYISPSCSSCRKVREWFTKMKIPFATKNILSGELTENDIREILTKSLDGTDEIMAENVKSISCDMANYATDDRVTVNVCMQSAGEKYDYDSVAIKDIYLRNDIGSGFPPADAAPPCRRTKAGRRTGRPAPGGRRSGRRRFLSPGGRNGRIS